MADTRTGMYPVGRQKATVWSGSLIQRMKAQPASFCAGVASLIMTKKVPPVGVATFALPGRKAAPTVNLLFSVRYARNAVEVMIMAARLLMKSVLATSQAL